MWIKFAQQLVNGLSVGSIYALIAVGYSLVYSILSFSNFSHGGFMVAGAYGGLFLPSDFLSIPVPIALILAIARFQVL